MNFLGGKDNAVLLTVHTQPKASRTQIVGVHGETLKIAVQAPPVDGEANEALTDFLAEFFHLAKRAVSLRSGASGRKKIFCLEGLSLAAARSRLEPFV